MKFTARACRRSARRVELLASLTRYRYHSIYILGLHWQWKVFDTRDTAFRSWLCIWSASRNTAARFSTPPRSTGWTGMPDRSSPKWTASSWPATARPITCTSWSNIPRSYPCRCWSMHSRVRLAGCYVRPDIARRYRNGVLWSPAYFAASAGGAPLAIIKQYVETQREHASSPS